MYDVPLSVTGDLMPPQPQDTYDQGSTITVDVVLTAHHKGHFVFKACPIAHGEVPTQECFDQYTLPVVKDLRYGAPVDTNFPERAYIPPLDYSESTSRGGTIFSFELQLPDELLGDLVLIQWHYLSGNTCVYPGYDEYAFPAAWGNMLNGLALCDRIPEDGNNNELLFDEEKLPEQFWNCAEVSILPSGPIAPTTPSPTYPLPAPVAPTPAQTYAPTPVPVTTPTSPGSEGTCGGGNVGNGICADSSLCCSKWGYCGSSGAHCSDDDSAPSGNTTPAPTPVTDQTSAPTTSSDSNINNDTNTDDWILSTESRCGISEVDARGNCRQVCENSGECADGEYCWSVFANYCGSKPDPTECNKEPTTGFRCGTSELMARETCGPSCSNDGDCSIAGGESCYAVNQNFCDC